MLCNNQRTDRLAAASSCPRVAYGFVAHLRTHHWTSLTFALVSARFLAAISFPATLEEWPGGQNGWTTLVSRDFDDRW